MSTTDWSLVTDVVHRLHDILELSIGEMIVLQRAVHGRFHGFDSYAEEIWLAVCESDLSGERKCQIQEILRDVIGSACR